MPFAKEEVLLAHRGRDLHKFIEANPKFVDFYHKNSIKTHRDGPECLLCGHRDGTCVKMLTHFVKNHQDEFFTKFDDEEEIEIQIPGN